jgi:hypothetical protein
MATHKLNKTCRQDLAAERITCIRYCNNQYLHIKNQVNCILIKERQKSSNRSHRLRAVTAAMPRSSNLNAICCIDVMLYNYLTLSNSFTPSVLQNINKKLFYLQLFTNLNTILNVLTEMHTQPFK